MKRFVMILMILTILLTSCVGQAGQNGPSTENSPMGGDQGDQNDPSNNMPPPNETKAPASVEDMTEIESVLAVSKLTEFCTTNEVAYKVEFEVDGLKRYVEIALPKDYQKKAYPCVLYFPDVGYGADFLVSQFAKKDVIVVRLFGRGSKGNEGIKDFCGEDFADAEEVLSICKACPFLSDGGIFTAGAVDGATYALKLAAEHPNDVAGCAVVDAVCDYEAIMETQGENTKSMFLYALGCTEEQLPEELAKRSPKGFCQDIRVPVLMFCYSDTPLVPKEHSEELKALLDNAGCETELHYLSPLSSDFNGTALTKLFPWIKNILKELK